MKRVVCCTVQRCGVNESCRVPMVVSERCQSELTLQTTSNATLLARHLVNSNLLQSVSRFLDCHVRFDVRFSSYESEGFRLNRSQTNFRLTNIGYYTYGKQTTVQSERFCTDSKSWRRKRYGQGCCQEFAKGKGDKREGMEDGSPPAESRGRALVDVWGPPEAGDTC